MVPACNASATTTLKIIARCYTHSCLQCCFSSFRGSAYSAEEAPASGSSLGPFCHGVCVLDCSLHSFGVASRRLVFVSFGKNPKAVGTGQNSVPGSCEWGSASTPISAWGNNSGEARAGVLQERSTIFGQHSRNAV